VPTLEKFLKVHFPKQQFRDAYKIEDAYKWAFEVDETEIPEELTSVKKQLENILDAKQIEEAKEQIED
jgi:patatin-like phospholipase/acyl hydrolase